MLEKLSDPWGSPKVHSTVINRQYFNYVNRKVIVSGNLVEEYFYDEPIRIDGGKKNISNRKRASNKRSSEYQGRSINKAQNTIRRLIQANFGVGSKFLTLTLNGKNHFDINSINECDIKFRLFIRSLKRRYPYLKYVAVREFQKRGAVHYHLIINLPYIFNDELAEIWGHGFIKINEITNVFGIGVYISKYLTKDLCDVRFKGVRTYIASRNLKRPIVYYGEEADSIIKEVIKPEELPSFENDYKSVCNGFVHFSEYNLTQPVLSEEKINEIRNIFEKI